MTENKPKYVGFTCAYTPIMLINAAGFTPFRILPISDSPEQSGRLLHDNLCPHIKRVLDRALDKDLPDLSGMVFINSCDAMRRLADAWRKIRPHDNVILLDLPATAKESNISFYAGEISRLWAMLNQWSGEETEIKNIDLSISKYDTISRLLEEVAGKIRQGELPGGSARMQEIYNRASTEQADSTVEYLEEISKQTTENLDPSINGVPVFVFGNVLPDPKVYSLFESCGVHVAGDDFCTGSRLFIPFDNNGSEDIFHKTARWNLSHPPCARTFHADKPASIAEDVLSKAKACNAKGVIGHTVKFCDPYLARLPMVRTALQKQGIPFLLLEGDCTTRSIGQQKTRIEAFVEMLR